VEDKEKVSFEDCIDLIDNEIRKRRSKWRLDAITWMDYEDVSQIIRSHIYTKWNQWDQSRPIEPWINKIITNQLKNLIRNHYHNFAKPCYNCPFNGDFNLREETNDSCTFTKTKRQDCSCPLFAKWDKGKKHAFEIKMATPLSEVKFDEPHFSKVSSLNLDFYIEKAHKQMREVLSQKQYSVYSMLFIEGMEEEDVAIKLGYKTNETGRKAGYKQIKNLKSKYKKIFLTLLDKNKIFE